MADVCHQARQALDSPSEAVLASAANYRVETAMTLIVRVMLVSLLFSTETFAQRLVDPASAAPEFRAAAEKRRAEQLKQKECAKKAESEKILRRDLPAYLNRCIAEATASER